MDMANIKQKYERRNVRYKAFCDNMDTGNFSRFQIKVVLPVFRHRFMKWHAAGIKELPTFSEMDALKKDNKQLNDQLGQLKCQLEEAYKNNVGLKLERNELKHQLEVAKEQNERLVDRLEVITIESAEKGNKILEMRKELNNK